MTLGDILPGWPKFCRLRTGKLHISATKGKTLCGFIATSFLNGDEASASSICDPCRETARVSGLTTFQVENNLIRLRQKKYADHHPSLVNEEAADHVRLIGGVDQKIRWES